MWDLGRTPPPRNRYGAYAQTARTFLPLPQCRQATRGRQSELFRSLDGRVVGARDRIRVYRAFERLNFGRRVRGDEIIAAARVRNANRRRISVGAFPARLIRARLVAQAIRDSGVEIEGAYHRDWIAYLIRTDDAHLPRVGVGSIAYVGTVRRARIDLHGKVHVPAPAAWRRLLLPPHIAVAVDARTLSTAIVVRASALPHERCVRGNVITDAHPRLIARIRYVHAVRNPIAGVHGIVRIAVEFDLTDVERERLRSAHGERRRARECAESGAGGVEVGAIGCLSHREGGRGDVERSRGKGTAYARDRAVDGGDLTIIRSRRLRRFPMQLHGTYRPRRITIGRNRNDAGGRNAALALPLRTRRARGGQGRETRERSIGEFYFCCHERRAPACRKRYHKPKHDSAERQKIGSAFRMRRRTALSHTLILDELLYLRAEFVELLLLRVNLCVELLY